MPIRKPKPTSAGRRFVTYPDYAEITRTSPEKSLVEGLKKSGGDLSKIGSVASFFVSRVDSKVNKLLESKIEAAKDPKEKKRLQGLLGKAAIANSKMAYEHFKQLHAGERWEALSSAGARPQRCQ